MLQQFGAFRSVLTEQNLRACKCTCQGCLCFFFSPENLFLHARDASLSFVLAAALPRTAGNRRSLESEMCLHWEHVTNYLLRLTLRDLAEAFTLLRCCLGQPYFRGWLRQFDCLCLTGVPQARCEPGQKVTLVVHAVHV